MQRDHSSMTQAVLTPLRSAWEDTVAAGLRQATDVELLWMLDEIEAQLGERAAPWDGAGLHPVEEDEIPDWDHKSPEELEAIARDLELQTAVGVSEASTVREGLHRPARPHVLGRPGRPALGNLRCEELEPRYPPSSILMARIAPPFSAAVTACTWSEQVALDSSQNQEGQAVPACEYGETVAESLAYALVA